MVTTNDKSNHAHAKPWAWHPALIAFRPQMLARNIGKLAEKLGNPECGIRESKNSKLAERMTASQVTAMAEIVCGFGIRLALSAPSASKAERKAGHGRGGTTIRVGFCRVNLKCRPNRRLRGEVVYGADGVFSFLNLDPSQNQINHLATE